MNKPAEDAAGLFGGVAVKHQCTPPPTTFTPPKPGRGPRVDCIIARGHLSVEQWVDRGIELVDREVYAPSYWSWVDSIAHDARTSK